MPGEEMFEAQVNSEVACAGCHAIVVLRTVAGENQRLGLVLPFQRFDVETPEIPFRGRDVGGIRVEMLRGERGDFRGSVAESLEIPLCGDGLGWIDGADD